MEDSVPWSFPSPRSGSPWSLQTAKADLCMADPTRTCERSSRDSRSMLSTDGCSIDTIGHGPAFMMAAGKLAWLRDTRPSDYASLAHVITLADWIAFRLTGQIACEPTLAAASGLLDIRTRAWASQMFEELGLTCPEEQLSEATEIRGAVNARELPSIAGTPVVVAGADTQCGMIGASAVEAGQVGIVAGWSAPVQMLVPEPIQSPEMKTWTGLFQEPELWAMESSAGDIGNVWRWLVETLSGSDLDYEELDRLAGTAPMGSVGSNRSLRPPGDGRVRRWNEARGNSLSNPNSNGRAEPRADRESDAGVIRLHDQGKP